MIQTRWPLFAAIVLLAPVTDAPAQTAAAASGEMLLERLVGQWRMEGTVRGRPVRYTLDATRVLQGKFVELRMEDVNRPAGYEARVFLGYDSVGSRYLAHWMDNFGPAFSIPHGTGAARGDTVEILFRYDAGPFRDRFVYHRPADRWSFRLESADSTGAWRLFAEYQVRRR